MHLLAKTNVAIYPIAHLPSPNPRLSLPVLLWHLDLQHRSGLESSPGEPNHLAIICATWIRTPCRIIVENLFVRHIGRVCEKDLGIRGGLMGEQDEEAGSFFVQDRAEGEVNLRETGCTPLPEQRVAESHVCCDR
jgi:hypothetical protein